MKWFYFTAAIVIPVLVFALLPDHMKALVYIGAGYLILSYILIPRKPQLGWNVSAVGNGLYLIPVAHLHRIDLMVVPAVFTLLSIYNLWRELTKNLKS